MSELSDRLQALLSHGQGETPVAVNVMLEADIEPSHARYVVQEIAACVTDQRDFEYLVKLRMVVCKVSVCAIWHLAKLPGVKWIDLESSASLESIIDQYDGG